METKRKVAVLTSEIETLKGSYPFNAVAIIDKQLEVEAYQDGLTRLTALQSELFSA